VLELDNLDLVAFFEVVDLVAMVAACLDGVDFFLLLPILMYDVVWDYYHFINLYSLTRGVSRKSVGLAYRFSLTFFKLVRCTFSNCF